MSFDGRFVFTSVRERGIELYLKRCGKCREHKLHSEFSNDARRNRGLSSWCKACAAVYQKGWHAKNSTARRTHCWRNEIKTQFGLSELDYNQMLADQEGRCAVCGTQKCSRGYRLCIDHDHQTGRVRGLLCVHCNIGIGHLRDDPDRLRAAALYLERHQ